MMVVLLYVCVDSCEDYVMMIVLLCVCVDSCEDLHKILASLHYLPQLEDGQSSPHSKEFLLELIVRLTYSALCRTVDMACIGNTVSLCRLWESRRAL